MKTTAELIELLKVKFPLAWFKEGKDFGADYSTAVWTGEGSYVRENVQMFDYNAMGADYQFGAHVDLCRFVEGHGYYVECYDAGTFFIFPE